MNGLYTLDLEVNGWDAHFAIRKKDKPFPLKTGVAKAGFGMDKEDFVNEIGLRIQEKLVELLKEKSNA